MSYLAHLHTVAHESLIYDRFEVRQNAAREWDVVRIRDNEVIDILYTRGHARAVVQTLHYELKLRANELHKRVAHDLANGTWEPL